MSAQLLMGNEAIALAALHSGINLACGYPGTPSTEIIETIARHNPGDVHVEWSVNEKVALELAIGASYAGMRALVTMKQVGLNVASDALMSFVYVGAKGGLVLVVADALFGQQGDGVVQRTKEGGILYTPIADQTQQLVAPFTVAVGVEQGLAGLWPAGMRADQRTQ